ncbi:MAG: TVP38/TMEM64 family protein [Desulfobacterales bacterium]|nr:TVP38/TMEM64 family protein [Desulfobacterales bacterium]
MLVAVMAHRRSGRLIVWAIACFLGIFLLIFLFRSSIAEAVIHFYHIFADKERIQSLLTRFGAAAPFFFIIFQILQVLLAPIPGEATGFIGGYLFGAAQGFLYSTIGLTAGSWINFTIGRFLGKKYVRKLIPAEKLKHFDRILKHQGIIVLFILFIIPGFPKDYLCFFLGLSTLPLKVFILLTAIGRMPGTFLLSLQGQFLFEQMYGLLALVLGLSFVLVFFVYLHRDNLYKWIERLNNS